MSSSWLSTLSTLLNSCQTPHHIHQLHAQAVVEGLLHHPLLLGKFVAAVSLSNHPDNTRYSDRILHHCRSVTVLTLNTLIRAYSTSPRPELCFLYYARILRSTGLFPDTYTFTFLVRSCAAHQATRVAAPAVHAAVVRRGFEADQHVQSGLICVYGRLCDLGMVESVFRTVKDPDLVTRTAVVTAVAGGGNMVLAREMFDRMPHRDLAFWNAIVSGYSQQGAGRGV